MPQDTAIYGDPETESSAEDVAPEDAATDETETADNPKEEEAETFLSPKGVSGDVSPGDTRTFKCVKVYDDEVEWVPVKGEEKPKKPARMSAAEEIDQMAMDKG